MLIAIISTHQKCDFIKSDKNENFVNKEKQQQPMLLSVKHEIKIHFEVQTSI